MEGKYVVTVKAYSKTYGIVKTVRVFKGEKNASYENAMKYAYTKAEKYNGKPADFSIKVQGEGWQTATSVNP